MSLRTDRALSQAMRYARHRQSVPAAIGKLRSAIAFDAFKAQFDVPQRVAMETVYLHTLAGVLPPEDRRTK